MSTPTLQTAVFALLSTACTVQGLPFLSGQNLAQVNLTAPVSYPAPKVGATFVHLFEWSWNDIADECETFLGPQGFDAVQVSPPMEHISGPAWWTRYQPVSYQLTSRSGNREQFESMVKRCSAVGVSIYADAVLNHMAAGSGTGIAGTTYGNRAVNGLYSQDDFHHGDDKGSNCAVNDFSNQHNVQYCDLVGLPDLCTSCSYVQETLGKYLNDLASLGVKGFRLDAAKHQEAGELGAVLAKGPPLYNFQEVIEGANEAVQPDMYYSLGQVTEFDYSRKLAPNVQSEGQMGSFSNFGENWGLMPSNNAVVFIDNHDTQRGEAKLTYKDGNLYTLANVLMLGLPYGYPKVMSSYAFSDHDAGPPSSSVNNCSDHGTDNGKWVCEHRQPMIAGMVKVRQMAADTPMANFQTGQNNDAIAFSRGNKAFIVINRSSSTWQSTLKSGLAAGQYTDALGSGNSITVQSDGSASFNVPSMTAMAIHV